MLAEYLIEAFIEKGLTVCTAESCTSGLVCAELTSVSGSSAVVAGGIIAYQTSTKETVLGLQDVTDDNVVSKAVANYMAIQASEKFGAPVAVATTGYLEPYNGRDPEAYVSVLFPGSPPQCERVELEPESERLYNRDRVVKAALELLSSNFSMEVEF